MRRLFQPLLLLTTLLVAACQTELPQSAPQPPSADSISARYRINLQPPDSSLFDSLRTIERRSGGKLGLAAIDLQSGWRTLYRGEETFPMASVAKLPMAIAFLRALDSGRYRLDSAVTLRPVDHRPGGSRLFRQVSHGKVTPTVHDLLVAMITESDNTACDYILRLAGGPAVADRLMKEIGLSDINISSYEGELILRWAGIDPASSDTAWTRERIYAKIEEAGQTAWDSARAVLVDDPHDAARPEALGRLLVLLEQGRLLSPRSTDTLLAIMGRTVTGKGRIAALLPPGTPIAHKTGTIGSVANDVGIVTLPGRNSKVALAIMVKGSANSVRGREGAIAAAAALVCRHLMRR